jgi:PAS domain S-box-containing protein
VVSRVARTTLLSLASFPAPARWAVRLLWVAGVVGFAIFVTAAAGGPGDPRSDTYETLFVGVLLVPAALCLLRGLLVGDQRWTWVAFGIGMVCWAGAEGHYLVILQQLENPPYPSLTDALWLSYYGFAFVGLLALMHSGLSQFRPRNWIDALIGGLALATIGAALLVRPILASTGGSNAAVATSIAYPLADVLIVSLLLGVLAINNWRPGRVWALLGVVWVLQGAVDTVYLFQAAAGTYAFGTLLDAAWLALMLLIAVAAWHQPVVTKGVWAQGWGALGVTIAFAVVGLFVLTYDHWHRIHDVAVVLAMLTLVAAFARTAMTFSEMRTLAHGRELSLQNELILNAAGEGILGIDADGAVTFANPAAARMTQYRPEEIAGRYLHGLVHHSRADGTPYPAEECPLLASLREGVIHHSDHDVYWRKDGTCFPVECTSTPMREGDRTTGAVVVFRDITDRREMQRVKDEFTSVVSHELRTPLTAIRGSLGLLESGALGPLPDKGRRMIQIAVQNTDRLVRLINDILDLERFDSAQTSLRRGPCDAAELISRATEALLPMAVDAGVTFAVDAEHAPFAGDADGLIQTLTNLLSNAVKFSPAGETVHVTSECRDGEILFVVRDRGRGIPADNLESIFERFQQVDASDSRQHGGTGLGLAICRSIVEQHRGTIWAQSILGEGSTLSFVLPAVRDDVAPSLVGS